MAAHLGAKRLDQITTLDVQSSKAIYREGTKNQITGKWLMKPTACNKTINNRLTVLGKLLKVACEWGILATMPCTVRLLKVQDGDAAFYADDVLHRVYRAGADVSSEALVMVLLAGDAGLRRGEIVGLDLLDLVPARPTTAER